MSIDGKTHSFHICGSLTPKEFLQRDGDREFAISYTKDDATVKAQAIAKKRPGAYTIEKRPILTIEKETT